MERQIEDEEDPCRIAFPNDVRIAAQRPPYPAYATQRAANKMRCRNNPTDCSRNAYWRWMIVTGNTAWHAKEAYKQDSDNEGDDDTIDKGPVWCYHRFGRTCTRLPDGRIVLIAGEHEDFYDPDFYVYNDVVVLDQQMGIQHIWGYPTDVFPGIDNHAAVYVPEQNAIWIIGGYSHDAALTGETMVYKLNVADWTIEKVEPRGGAGGDDEGDAAREKEKEDKEAGEQEKEEKPTGCVCEEEEAKEKQGKKEQQKKKMKKRQQQKRERQPAKGDDPGPPPGCLTRHTAQLHGGNCILVQGGKMLVRDKGGKITMVPNNKTYLLNMQTGRWKKL